MRNLFVILINSLFILTTFAQNQIGNDIDGEFPGDHSGTSVSLSADGTRLAIGAPGNDGSYLEAGHARVYELINGNWIQVGGDIDGAASDDASGHSVSLSSDGQRVAIGARRNDGVFFHMGHVRIYEDNNGSWVQLGSDINGEDGGDEFGHSVALSADGSRVAIGGTRNAGTGSTAGHVRVYQYNGNDWQQIGDDIDGEAAGDLSGYSVSLSADGSRVGIGATDNDGGTASLHTGHARVYQETGGVWSQLGADLDGEDHNERFGVTVSLSSDGKRIAVGGPRNNGGGGSAGYVRIYQENGGVWSQLGTDLEGKAAGDSFGISVSLSYNGSRVAIGAPDADGNFSADGMVQIYEEIGGSWIQVGSDIVGEGAGDVSGYSVSITADGSIVAIGALANDGVGISSGHVRVYGGLPISVPVNEIPTTKPFNVFPNPSNGLINFQIDNSKSKFSFIRIVDQLGSVKWEGQLTNASSIDELQPILISEAGLYFVTVNIGNEVFHERVIVH